MARCPECNFRIEIPEGITRNDRVYCPGCGAELEVLRRKPLELEAVFDFDDDNDLLEELEIEDELEWDIDEDDDDW